MTSYRTLSIDSLLRRVAAARRAGDVTAAQPEWDTCVERLIPRMRVAVKAFKTSAVTASPRTTTTRSSSTPPNVRAG